jgi:hypothetical protein
MNDPSNSSNHLIDRIVSMTCSCFHGTQTEECIELQIIKISLTIMTSTTIVIEQRSVVEIVRTCFNIYLTTRSKINEATAQGSLSQILRHLFSQMEEKLARTNHINEQQHSTDIDQEQCVIRDILDELIEKISYGN